MSQAEKLRTEKGRFDITRNETPIATDDDTNNKMTDRKNG